MRSACLSWVPPPETTREHLTKTLLVTHYFPPEIGAPQARLGDLARFWSEEGDEIVVLTGMPNHPTGIVPERYRRRIRVEEDGRGYRIVRTWLYATPNERIVRKTLGHLSFMVTSVVLGATRVGKPDVVVVSSPTFFSIFSAWLLARLRRAALVVEIRDLWPAIFVELGVLKNPTLIGVLERLELLAYRVADAVVVVSEGFRDDLVRRGVPAEKVHTIRNGVDLDAFTGGEPGTWRKELGVDGHDTLVLYIGAHGISHGLDAVLDAADHLRGEPVRIAFVGDGATKAALQKQADTLGLDNVTFHASVLHDAVPDVLAAADICLVPLRGDVPLFSTFIPSKMFEYLAASKAVIGAVRGEPAAILRDAGALVVEPGDGAALADAIRALAADPARRAMMADRGRLYVTAHFDRRVLADRYRDLLATVVG